MANFLDDLQQCIGDDIIEAVDLGTPIEKYFEEDPRNIAAAPFMGKLLSWEEAKPLLNYEYDQGYGRVDCHMVTLWSKDWIYFIHEYDGATWPVSVPRNPKATQQ